MDIAKEKRAICAKCILPENKPDIYFDDKGVCNICRQAEKVTSGEDSKHFLETEFVKILSKYKDKHPYDCMVMCSGGKDSTASLYYMKKRYKLNVLAFMFDQGFETDEAKENVRNAVEVLGVDFLFFKSDYMKNMFTKMIKSDTKAVICHPCSLWYMQLAFDTARRYDIPIIIAGWTKGQSTKHEVIAKGACSFNAPEFRSMALATKKFLDTLRKDPQYKDFPKSMEDVLVKADKRHKALVLSPHWFLNVHPDEYTALISRELNWKCPDVSYPAKTTNCYMNFISVYLTLKHYGYTHYHVEASKLIRMGLLARQEALKGLEINFDKKLLDKISAKIGCGVI